MRWIAGGLFLLLLLGAAVLLTFRTVPPGNTDATHFDTLIVLGCPANPDGSASPEEQTRTEEAVREFRAGRAAHIVFSGGAAHNQYAEADVMARVALAEGVPAEAIEEDRQAQNTIQNIFYSHTIMQRHGWQSAEVISSPAHVTRSALILQHWQFAWRVHAAPWPASYSRGEVASHYREEVEKMVWLRWHGFYHSPFLPGS